jgi:hypothetical protein
MPPAIQLKMRRDLAFLPAWYASSDDSVFIEDELSPEFINSLNLFGNVPVAITVKDFISKKECFWDEQVYLWGISPGSIHFFEEINKKHDLRLTIPKWRAEYFHLCSRLSAKECLEYIIEAINTGSQPENNSETISSSILPSFYSEIESIENIVEQSDGELLVKTPYSSSGRGLLWLPPGKIHQSSRQVLNGMLKKQGKVSIEKSLNKITDFAMEFFSDGSGNVCFSGYSLFQTDSKGNYMGNILLPQKDIELKINSFISIVLLKKVKYLLTYLLKKKFSFLYEGCVGVDMMIYEENGVFRLHPCVEINMRYNMGFLSSELYKNYIDENSNGIFRIDYVSQHGRAIERHKKMKFANPAIFNNNKISSGYLSLCPVTEETNYHAFIILNKK